MAETTNTIAVSVPMPADETTGARKSLELAQNYRVTTPEEYECAADDLKLIKARYNRIDSARKTLKRPIDEAAKQVQGFFTPALTLLKRAEDALKRKLVDYDNAQEVKRRQMQAEAEQRAAAERLKLQERSRKALGKGDDVKAAELQDRADMVVAPVFQVATPKVAGLTSTEVYLFEIENEAAVPREYCSPDPKKIRAVVDALRSEARIPGVRTWRDTRISSRAG